MPVDDQATRDALLAIIDAHPQVFDDPCDVHQRLIRGAAERCGNVGPFAKAVELFRKLAPLSGNAVDWYKLSEALTHGGGDLDEAVEALKTAMRLEPRRFDTQANRETVSMATASSKWCPGCSREVDGRCHHFNCAIGPHGLAALAALRS